MPLTVTFNWGAYCKQNENEGRILPLVYSATNCLADGCTPGHRAAGRTGDTDSFGESKEKREREREGQQREGALRAIFTIEQPRKLSATASIVMRRHV